MTVNYSSYLLANDSVILKDDDEKYDQDSDDSSTNDCDPCCHAPEAACTVRYKMYMLIIFSGALVRKARTAEQRSTMGK